MKKVLVGMIALASLGAAGVAGVAWAAGPPYTVAVGGSTSGAPDPYTATSTGTVRLQIKNASSATVTLKCSSLTMTGDVTKGASVNPWASIAASTWSGCTFIPGATTVTQAGTISMNGTGSNATTDTETIQGNASNVAFNIASTPSPSICSFQVRGSSASSGGTASTWFNEPTQ